MHERMHLHGVFIGYLGCDGMDGGNIGVGGDDARDEDWVVVG